MVAVVYEEVRLSLFTDDRLTQPSAGTAFVEDLNIQIDMKKVYTSMGVCPQHE